ncbi:MAG: GHKL domain-containing protein [Clostridia bacterium]|nr:GHKL domain-containing protein [Clostridia bacterium]
MTNSIFWHFLYLMGINTLETAGYFLLFAGTLKRRRRFGLRLALYFACMIALCFAVSYGLFYFYVYVRGYAMSDGTTAGISVIMYLVVFAVSVGMMFLCFDEKPGVILYTTVAGKCAATISLGLYNILLMITNVPSMYVVILYGSDVWSWLFYFVIHILCLTAAWFAFVRRMARYKDSMDRDLNGYILAVFIAVLAVELMLEVCGSLYGEATGTGTVLQYDMAVIRYLFYAVTVIFSFTILLIEFFMFSWVNKVQERNLAKIQFENYKKQSEDTKKSIETINIKCHDLKHQISGMLSGSGIDPGYIKELQDAISIYDTNIDTGNDDLNVLLMQKSAYCDINRITMSVMMDGKALDFMSLGDLDSFFGNAIDNAIEYLLKVDEKSRFVRLSSMQRDNLLTIRIENYYEGTPIALDKSGFPITSKPDKENHGFGVRSIKAVAEKYGGVLSFKTEDGLFVISAGFFSR